MLRTGYQTTQRMHWCQLEHNNFFRVLHEAHSPVCVSQDDICLLFCCGQMIPSIHTVAGSLKTVGPFLHSLHCPTGHPSWGPQVGLFVVDFCIWHFPLKCSLLTSIWFLTTPQGFSESIWIQNLSSCGKWCRWLVDKMIIYLSLGTKRVVNPHGLHGLVLDGLENQFIQKASDKLLLVSLLY